MKEQKKSKPMIEKSLYSIIRQKSLAFLALHERNNVDPKYLYRKMMDEVDRSLIETVYQYTDQSQVKTAKILGIHRNTLRDKLKQHKICTEKPLKRPSRRRTRND